VLVPDSHAEGIQKRSLSTATALEGVSLPGSDEGW
jgi:hypothetical protein